MSAAAAWAAAAAAAMEEKPTRENIFRAALEGAGIGSQYGLPGIAPSVEKRIELAWKMVEKLKDPRKVAKEYL